MWKTLMRACVKNYFFAIGGKTSVILNAQQGESLDLPSQEGKCAATALIDF